MNILLVDHTLPSSMFSGKTVRLIHIYGRLAKRHRVILLKTSPSASKESSDVRKWADTTFHKILSLSEIPKPHILRKLLAFLMLKPWFDLKTKVPNQISSIQKEVRQIIEAEKIDILINFSIESAPYCELIDNIPWIQDLGDSLVLWIQRQIHLNESFNQRTSLLLRNLRESRFEKNMIQKSGSTIFVAEDDASFYSDLRSKIKVVPNGVDTQYFNPQTVQQHNNSKDYLVFSGHMNFKPNVDAVCFFAEHIFPLIRKSNPNIEFYIVGADPTDAVKSLANQAGITVTGKVPDIRPYLAGARAFVCPMRLGSGIKNKILEAMSMKLPIISYEMALRGIAAYPSELIRVASNPIDFSNQVLEELANPMTTEKKGRLREFVENNYAWNKAIQTYETIFEELTK